jgi:hypothetical protein
VVPKSTTAAGAFRIVGHASLRSERGATVVGIGLMSNTWYFIFYAIALVLFIAGGIGIKAGGERVQLVGLGLAAMIFPLFWDRMAAL